jgi:hypothetical protein
MLLIWLAWQMGPVRFPCLEFGFPSTADKNISFFFFFKIIAPLIIYKYFLNVFNLCNLYFEKNIYTQHYSKHDVHNL